MAPGASQWDHKADKDLLLAIIDEGSLKSILWPNISNKMVAKGYTFTKEACRQHFQKIRKESRTGGTDGASTPTHTPRSTKTGTGKATPSKGSKSLNSSFASGYDDYDDEEITTPTKRKRTMKMEGQENGSRQSAPMFKIEDMGAVGSPIDLENEDLYEAEYA